MLCTASTLGVLIWWPGSNGAWLVLTVPVVTKYGADATVKRTWARLTGTIVNVAIAAFVASLAESEAVLIGISVLLVAISLGPHSYFSSSRPARCFWAARRTAPVVVIISW